MALELGIFIGARSFGSKPQKGKKFYVFVGEFKQYNRIISDISGQDPGCHNNTPEDAVKLVRQWLSDQVSTKPGVPGRNELCSSTTNFVQCCQPRYRYLGRMKDR
jgi:hypothetical protein